MTDKFVMALARHETAKQAADAISKRIGVAISRCPIAIKEGDWELSNAERAELFDEKTSKQKTHLWSVYNASAVYGEHFDHDGQREALHPRNDGCRHCYRAHVLIEKRRALRAELGRARLAIRALGKIAIKMQEGIKRV